MAEADATTAVVPLQTSLNVTALAKQFGVARTTIQRRLKKGWVPPTPRRPRAALPAARVLRDAAPHAAPAYSNVVTLAALVSAVSLAGVSGFFDIDPLAILLTIASASEKRA